MIHNVTEQHLNICAQQRLRSGYAPSQSEQSRRCLHEEILHPWHEEILHPWLSRMCPVKILISLRKCAGWSESSMDAISDGMSSDDVIAVNEAGFRRDLISPMDTQLVFYRQFIFMSLDVPDIIISRFKDGYLTYLWYNLTVCCVNILLLKEIQLSLVCYSMFF